LLPSSPDLAEVNSDKTKMATFCYWQTNSYTLLTLVVVLDDGERSCYFLHEETLLSLGRIGEVLLGFKQHRHANVQNVVLQLLLRRVGEILSARLEVDDHHSIEQNVCV